MPSDGTVEKHNTSVAHAASGRVSYVHHDLDRILIDREAIARRVAEMGAEIRRDLDDLGEHEEIVLIPILTGSIIFVADLIRQLPRKVRISVMDATSYSGRTTRSRGEPIVSPAPSDLAGRHVLIVDDILDSGRTITRIREEIARCRPKSLRACVLLRKRIPAALAVPCEYVGFDTPNEFLVGYGLDYDGYYRNLPDIGVLKKEAL